MQDRVFAGNGKAQPGAARVALTGGIRAPETVEYQLFLPGFQAHAVIRDRHAHGLLRGGDIDDHGFALRVVDGIGQEVAQNALDAPGIGLDGDPLVWHIADHLHVELLG